MIRRLKRRLIFTAMLSVLLVVAVLISILNIGLALRNRQAEDEMLALIRENGGIFPHQPWQGGRRDRRNIDLSAESPFDTRYCSVTLNEEGELISSHMDRIASLDLETALTYARQLALSSSESGYIGEFRYLSYTDTDGQTVLFLFCGKQMEQQRSALLISLAAGGIILLAVFLMLLLLSGRMVQPLAESYQKQRRFITDAGHELRTPLTIINADTELLMMDQEDNEWLQDIRRQTERLSGLTNDLIYLSRMEEERKREALAFPLSEVCAEVVSSFQAPALARGLTLSSQIAPMVSLTGDESEIRRLLSVLLDNAVKYASDGGAIHFSLERVGKNAEIRCQNPCEPMSREALQGMFDRFYRADSARNSKKSGFGIGLSVASAIVQNHKGKISASQQDGVLTITAVLPGS